MKIQSTSTSIARCDGCLSELRLVGIESDPADRTREIRTFECEGCSVFKIKTTMIAPLNFTDIVLAEKSA